MFVGVGAARVRDMFQQAEAKAPCIIFIDELDALGKSRGTSVIGGHDEREQTLNALLVEMDGFGSNSGVIVMAATNRPETLDPALLRPGRFDRHVLVDRPDIRGREAILKVHVKNVKLDPTVELKEVAAITPGFVGADLANLVNEAALLAARGEKQAVGMEEFNEGVERVTAGLEKKQRIMNEDEKHRVAYHESGHALVAYSLPNTDPVHKVSIIPRGLAALGYTMQRPEGDRFLMTQSELESRTQVLLAGTIAEEIMLHRHFDRRSERLGAGHRNRPQHGDGIRHEPAGPRELSREQPLAVSGGCRRAKRSSDTAARRRSARSTRKSAASSTKRSKRSATSSKRGRASLEALTKRLMEVESIDADELKRIVEENSPGAARRSRHRSAVPPRPARTGRSGCSRRGKERLSVRPLRRRSSKRNASGGMETRSRFSLALIHQNSSCGSSIPGIGLPKPGRLSNLPSSCAARISCSATIVQANIVFSREQTCSR